MRFDTVLLILIIILVAFGFTISEIWELKQELIDVKKQAVDALKQRDDLVIENQGLREQIGILNAAILEKQNELETAKVACLEKTTTTSIAGLSAAEQTGQILPEAAGWIVSFFITLGSLLKKQFKPMKKDNGSKDQPVIPSENYVKLSDGERKMILNSRRNR